MSSQINTKLNRIIAINFPKNTKNNSINNFQLRSKRMFEDLPSTRSKKTYNDLTKSFKMTRAKMELLLPAKKPNFTSSSTNKIMKEISNMSKHLSENQNSNISFLNKPIVNLKRGEFDFSPKNIIKPSPTNKILVGPVLNRERKDYTKRNFQSSRQMKTKSKLLWV